ncbi:MAG: hypothetical protein LUF84_04085 [Clostridiales bacterium]|nr:hypothetical protein [Clostridiales bacterium]
MAEDIAPALLEELQATFLENLENDKTAATLLEKIQNGTANYEIAGNYAEQVGAALADAFSAILTADALPDGKMYWNIADRVVRPLLEQDYELVSDAAVQMQTALNQAAGIGIKAQKAALNTDRVDGLLNKISAADSYDDVAWALGEPVRTFSRSVVDDTLKTNAEFQSRSGLQPKIVRKAEFKCCEWCSALAGTYEYPNVPDDIYRRHENCRCTVEYDPGDGRRQNVWTKQWTNTQSTGKITSGKTKYAPSPQRQVKGIQVSHKKYAQLTGIVNTRYPNLLRGDERIIYDSNYAYKIVADGYGGFTIKKRIKLK